MVPKEYEIQILDKSTNKTKQYLLRRFEKKDVDRIFKAWNNPQSYRYNSVDWNKRDVQCLVEESWPSSWGMYFMVLEDLETNQIVSTCRFGGKTGDSAEKVWDFGYSTFRSDDKEKYTIQDVREVFNNGITKDNLCWGKGYCSIMLDAIIKFAQDEGVDKLISGADGMNWGSQKVMMKSGFTFYEIEKDGDVDFILKLKDENGKPLTINKPSKEELAHIWENHMEMVKKAHSRFILSMIVKRNEKKHYYKSLMFLLLTKASEILQLNKNEVDKTDILEQEIESNFNQFNNNEKRGFKKSFKSYIKRWEKRKGNNDFDQADVEYYLNCCEILNNVMDKTNNVKHQY